MLCIWPGTRIGPVCGTRPCNSRRTSQRDTRTPDQGGSQDKRAVCRFDRRHGRPCARCSLPVLLGTLPVDDDVNIPYRPGFASRYAFRLDMLSERSSFLSGQIRNEKRTAGMPYTVARTRTVREASDRQRAKRLPCRRPLAPRCYTPGCLKSVRWRETNRRGGAHFLPLPLGTSRYANWAP